MGMDALMFVRSRLALCIQFSLLDVVLQRRRYTEVNEAFSKLLELVVFPMRVWNVTYLDNANKEE
jgi:hypothetical protein